MCSFLSSSWHRPVAFRKEGVDWNISVRSSFSNTSSRLPQGRCGLKYSLVIPKGNYIQSPSARKVWIEMLLNCKKHDYVKGRLPQGRCGLKYIIEGEGKLYKMSPSARKVWIEIFLFHLLKRIFVSPSARKVWIEISCGGSKVSYEIVAFRKEGVDWNSIPNGNMKVCAVAFRKEGVDWNTKVLSAFTWR